MGCCASRPAPGRRRLRRRARRFSLTPTPGAQYHRPGRSFNVGRPHPDPRPSCVRGARFSRPARRAAAVVEPPKRTARRRHSHSGSLTPLRPPSPTARPTPMLAAVGEGPAEVRAAVVVVHWGSRSNTLACLRSVGESTLRPSQLVVVDNGTGTLPPEDVASAAPHAILLSLPENLGFGGGTNAGIRRAPPGG